MKDCFVIMPIGIGEAYRVYRNRYDYIIKPAVEDLKIDGNQIFKCIRADFISDTGSITRVVIQRLYSADVVIADLTDLNANVFYELGVRQALRNKTILIALQGTKPPFDVGDLRIIPYEDRVGGEKDIIPRIQEMLRAFLSETEILDSPVFNAIPQLCSKGDEQEIQAKLMSIERENESLRSKLAVAEQTNISFQQTLSLLTEAINNMTSRLGVEEKRITEEEIEKAVNERKQILVKPKMFAVPNYTLDEQCVFVLMPFSEEFQPVYEIISHAAGEVGLKSYRADDIMSTGSILNDIFEYILRAGLVVADLTGMNPNVLYEVGIATTIGKETVFLTQNIDDVPFDLRHLRVIVYGGTLKHAVNLKEMLQRFFQQYIQSKSSTDKLEGV